MTHAIVLTHEYDPDHSAGAVCSLAQWAVHPNNGHKPTAHEPNTDTQEEA
jgi:hypothetical protein